MLHSPWTRYLYGPLIGGFFAFGAEFTGRGGGGVSGILAEIAGAVIGMVLLSLTRFLVARGARVSRQREGEMPSSRSRSQFSDTTMAVFYFMFMASLGAMSIIGIVQGQVAFAVIYAALSIGGFLIGLWLTVRARRADSTEKP